MKTPNRRHSSQIIDKKFQYRIIARIGGIGLFYFSFCLATAIFLPSLFAKMGVGGPESGDQFAFRMEILFKVLLVPLLVSFVGMWIQGLQETFRVAGPAYRLRTVFSQLKSLSISRGVKTREKDYLQDTTAVVNEGLIRVHDHLEHLQKVGVDVQRMLKSNSPPDAETWDQVSKTMNQLVDGLFQFELQSAVETSAPAHEPSKEAPTPAGVA